MGDKIQFDLTKFEYEEPFEDEAFILEAVSKRVGSHGPV